MAEIAKARGSNGLTVISTFSGCGGGCLGLEWAGFEILAACEFVDAARETYAANHPGVPIDSRDIREIAPSDLLTLAGVERGGFDLLEGSPPCSAFSTAGNRSRDWGESKTYSATKQVTDDLFYEFARLLEGMQPRAFVAENVSGLVKGVAKGYFKRILARLGDAGYVVEARLLDAQWLGVPQSRQRLIFVGFRNDLGKTPTFPDPLGYRYSICDALPWLDGGVKGDVRWKERHYEDEPVGTIQQHGRGGHSRLLAKPKVTGRTGPHFKRESHPLDEPIGTLLASDPAHTRWEVDGPGDVDPETGQSLALEGYAIAPAYDKLREGQTDDRYFNLVKPDRNAPSPTITQSGGSSPGTAGVAHPYERRKFSLGELRRLSGFPDDFVLTGTYAERWERIGRAVPPPMMRAVGVEIAATLKGETRAPIVVRHPKADAYRDLLVELTAAPRRDVGVMLSHGIDSNAILAALLANGVTPTCLSFRVEGVESKDWAAARRIAEHHSLPFLDVEITTDLDALAEQVREVIQRGVRGKARIECSLPVWRALDVAKREGLRSVYLGTDRGQWALRRKEAIDAHDGRLDDVEFMAAQFVERRARPNPSQWLTNKAYADDLKIGLACPYFDVRFIDVLDGETWRSLNTPRQKMPLRDAFPECDSWGTAKTATPFQLGDSQISTNYARLLTTAMNTGGWKSVVGLYNDLIRQAEA
jgi:DNA (cytosine-5)-methyltransferase 1